MKSGEYNYGLLNHFLVLFVALKLTDYIDWSWWLVLSPFFLKVVLIFLNDYVVRSNK